MHWGLGIEHEVNFYEPDPVSVQGSTVKERFGKDLKVKDTRDRKLMVEMFEPQESYEVIVRYPISVVYLAIKYGLLPQLLKPQSVEFLNYFETLRQNPSFTKWEKKFSTQGKFKGETLDLINEMTREALPKVTASTTQLEQLAERITLDFSNLGLYVEFVTKNFENATVGGIVAELEAAEALFLTLAKALTGSAIAPAKFGNTALIQINHDMYGNRLPSPRLFTDYNGSYHINITLPFLKSEQQRPFLERTRAAMLVIQWVEPLLMATYGQPDPFSFGDDDKFTEASFRMLNNRHSALATQDVSEDADVVEQLTKGSLTLRQVTNPPQYRKEIYDILTGYLEPRAIGSDFRRDPEKTAFGFEYRTTDHFPTKYLPSLIRILILLSDHSYVLWKDAQLPQDPRFHKTFTAVTNAIFVEGWNALLTQKHIDTWRDMLSLPLIVTGDRVTAQKVFSVIVQELWALYGSPRPGLPPKGMYSRYMSKTAQGEYYDAGPIVPNLNKEAFEEVMRFWKGRARGSDVEDLVFVSDKLQSLNSTELEMVDMDKLKFMVDKLTVKK